MSLLYYWRRDNYQDDLDNGATYHLNQANPLLHEIALGDSLWAFTRNSAGEYVLAAELVVKAKTHNPPNHKYGRYRLWGDLRYSRYFVTEGQQSVEPVVRRLDITANAQHLGQSFQGRNAVKSLSALDHQILLAFAGNLPLHRRARLIPEEHLEAALLRGNGQQVQEVIKTAEPGVAEARRRYLYREAPARNRQLVMELREIYEGQCQICRWSPRSRYGVDLCHAHHINWLSRGGADVLENLMLVCPNHHEAIHQCDAPFDFESGDFIFDLRPLKVRLNNHLDFWDIL